MEERVFQTHLGDIHYWVSRRGKEAPWLVFLPGLSADHTLFDRQTAHFAMEYNCLVWDAPGHGRSRPFRLDFSLEDVAFWLYAIFRAEEVTEPILVGQSLGGYIAQVFLVQYPDTAGGFVSIDSAPLSRRYYQSWELAALKHTQGMYRAIPWRLLLEWGILGTARTAYGRSVMRETWSAYSREEFCALAGFGFRILAEAVEARPAYPISCPVLLLCGTGDLAGSAKRYNRAWAGEEGRPIRWLKGAGHNANTDRPVQVNRHIEAFVKTIR